MTLNEAKMELKSYLDMECSKHELQEWIDSKKYDSNKLTSSFSSEPKGSPKCQDQMAEKLAKALDTESKIKFQIEEMNQKQAKIFDKIMSLEKPYQTALFSLYIQGKTIEQVGNVLNYSRSQTIRIINRAVEMYAEIQKIASKS